MSRYSLLERVRIARPPDDALRRAVRGDERVVWSGRREPAYFERWMPVLILSTWILGIPFTFAGLMGGIVASRRMSLLDIAGSGLFAAIGLALLVTPYYQREKVRRTRYAISTRRLLAVTAFPGVVVTEVPAAEVKQLTVVPRGPSAGDVVVGTVKYLDNYDKVERERALGFEEVADPMRVAQTILDTFGGEAPASFGGGVTTAKASPPFGRQDVGRRAFLLVVAAWAGFVALFGLSHLARL